MLTERFSRTSTLRHWRGTEAAIAVADFNGDHNLDLAVANWASGTVSILLGNGDGTFQTHVDYSVGGPFNCRHYRR